MNTQGIYHCCMSSIEELLREAKQLPQDQRLTLAHRLLESDEPPVSEDVERAWDFLIRERIQRYDRGKAVPTSRRSICSS